jgi:hypothetical protein
VSDSNEQQQTISLEKQHARGYKDVPQDADEIAEWEAEQVWDEYESEGTE